MCCGGHCYDCRAIISIRYPVVEAIVAVLFVTLFYSDLWRPIHTTSLEVAAALPLPNGSHLAARYVGDLWLTCSLLCAALIEINGRRPPRRIYWLAIAIGVLLAAAFSAARAGLIVHVFREDAARAFNQRGRGFARRRSRRPRLLALSCKPACSPP